MYNANSKPGSAMSAAQYARTIAPSVYLKTAPPNTLVQPNGKRWRCDLHETNNHAAADTECVKRISKDAVDKDRKHWKELKESRSKKLEDKKKCT